MSNEQYYLVLIHSIIHSIAVVVFYPAVYWPTLASDAGTVSDVPRMNVAVMVSVVFFP